MYSLESDLKKIKWLNFSEKNSFIPIFIHAVAKPSKQHITTIPSYKRDMSARTNNRQLLMVTASKPEQMI